MNKKEILQQSAGQLNMERTELLAQRIDELKKSEMKSLEELTAKLKPLAESLAALMSEMLQVLDTTDSRNRELNARLMAESNALARIFRDTAATAQSTCQSLVWTLRWPIAKLFSLMAATVVLTVLLLKILGFWSPPVVKNQNLLNPEAIAEMLKPAIIKTLRHSPGR